MEWVTLDGIPVKNVFSAVSRELVSDDPDRPEMVYVGTDSQQTKWHTTFVTVLVVRRPSKGARVFYCKRSMSRIESLRQRLMEEAWTSLSIAWDLIDYGIGPGFISIHVDANTDPAEVSTQYAQELAGLIVGQGFKVSLKPEAWAASRAADYALKKRVMTR